MSNDRFNILTVNPAELRFDPRNPRLPQSQTPDQRDAIAALVDQADIGELIKSITHSGWLDYEPMIVLEDENIVLEGNRRLAALSIIRDPALQEHFGFTLPEDVHPEANPELVRVAFVKHRSDARDFIGFKHVNGPHKWDSLAKAKFAWEWLQEDQTLNLADVAERLGDGHNTVARLVNGYVVLDQARDLGFDEDDRSSGRFAFSHLYTILTRPTVREWLKLNAGPSELLPANPISGTEQQANLNQLMVWLYGQGDAKSVIKSQNPNLNQLAEVIGNRTATAVLASQGDLKIAYSQVEDKTRRFSENLFALQSAAKEVSGSLGDYEHDPDLLQMAEGIQRTMRSIVSAMTAARDEDPVES